MTQREMDLRSIESEMVAVDAERRRLTRLATALREARTRLHVGVDPATVATDLARERARLEGGALDHAMRRTG